MFMVIVVRRTWSVSVYTYYICMLWCVQVCVTRTFKLLLCCVPLRPTPTRWMKKNTFVRLSLDLIVLYYARCAGATNAAHNYKWGATLLYFVTTPPVEGIQSQSLSGNDAIRISCVRYVNAFGPLIMHMCSYVCLSWSPVRYSRQHILWSTPTPTEYTVTLVEVIIRIGIILCLFFTVHLHLQLHTHIHCIRLL